MEAVLSFLIPVLIGIESGGDPNAVGDDGEAVGVLQIHPCVIDDVNRVFRTRYTPADRLNAAKSMTICRCYLLYWGYRYTQNTGHEPTPEVLARIWNGGPAGWKKEATRGYWKKVQAAIRQKPEPRMDTNQHEK